MEDPRGAGIDELAGDRVVDGVEVAALAQVRVLQQVLHRRDGRRGEADLLQRDVRLVNRAPGQLGLDQRQQRVVVLGPDQPVGEQRVVGPFGVAHELHQARPVVLGDAHDEQQAVLELHHPPGADDARAKS